MSLQPSIIRPSVIWDALEPFLADRAPDAEGRAFAAGYLLYEAGEHRHAFGVFSDLFGRGILPLETAYAAGVCLEAQQRWDEAAPWFERYDAQPFLIKRWEIARTRHRDTEADALADRLIRPTHDFLRKQDRDTSHGFPNYEREPEVYRNTVAQYASYFEPGDRFLEYGCNSGGMLNALYEAGYRNNGGIEINRPAVDEFARRRPEAFAATQVWCGDVEAIAPTIADRSFDVVYSMATLSNLLRDDAVRDMARIARRLVWINEVDPRNRCLLPSGVFFHDYVALLTEAGFEPVLERAAAKDRRYDRIHVSRLFRRAD